MGVVSVVDFYLDDVGVMWSCEEEWVEVLCKGVLVELEVFGDVEVCPVIGAPVVDGCGGGGFYVYE